MWWQPTAMFIIHPLTVNFGILWSLYCNWINNLLHLTSCFTYPSCSCSQTCLSKIQIWPFYNFAQKTCYATEKNSTVWHPVPFWIWLPVVFLIVSFSVLLSRPHPTFALPLTCCACLRVSLLVMPLTFLLLPQSTHLLRPSLNEASSTMLPTVFPVAIDFYYLCAFIVPVMLSYTIFSGKCVCIMFSSAV